MQVGREAEMTRYMLLERIALAPDWTTLNQLIGSNVTRSLRETTREQLRRMAYRRLIDRRRLYPWRRDPWAFRITMNGRKRLAWYRRQGLL
jgi:hypothetical protein